ncbi:hypothetical protein C8R47DRAFT_593027 [Mycena vitilis]|nr:hypothetical protein C8R47DRAFT_593027 [Mycena vitilis]
MGHARLPFIFLVLLLTQLALSWAAPTPDYTLTLFGLPITIDTGNDDGHATGGRPITSTTPIQTPAQMETTTRASPTSTTTRQQASPTTHTTTTPTTEVVPHTTVSSPSHTTAPTSSHTAVSASSQPEGVSSVTSLTKEASATAPPILADLSTDTSTAKPLLVSSTPAAGGIVPASSAGLATIPLSHRNQAGIVLGVVIPAVALLLVLAAVIAYKRRRDRAKQLMILRPVTPMRETDNGDGAWTRFDTEKPWGFVAPPPPQLTVPPPTLDLTRAAALLTYTPHPTLPSTPDDADQQAPTDDGHSEAECAPAGAAPTDDGHTLLGHVHASIFGSTSASEWTLHWEAEPALAESRPTSMSSVSVSPSLSGSATTATATDARSEKRREAGLSEYAPRTSHYLAYDGGRYSQPPPAYEPDASTPPAVPHLE